MSSSLARVSQYLCLWSFSFRFSQFIGKQMRLSKVEYAPRAESGPIFTFYMGKNTPERKDYIMDKLVVPVEE